MISTSKERDEQISKMVDDVSKIATIVNGIMDEIAETAGIDCLIDGVKNRKDLILKFNRNVEGINIVYEKLGEILINLKYEKAEYGEKTR